MFVADSPLADARTQVAEKGAECMSLLGLGDVVLPGLFIALILRFDESRKPGSRKYFYTVLVAYLIGLAATYVAMVWSEHAQPGTYPMQTTVQTRSPKCRPLPSWLLPAPGCLCLLAPPFRCSDWRVVLLSYCT